MQEACSSQPNAVSVNIQHRTRGNLWLYCPTIERKIRPRSNVSHNATRATLINPTPATEPLRHHRGVSSDWGRGDRPVAPTDFVRRRVSDTGPQCQSAKSAPLCGQPQGLPLQTQTRRAMACGFMGTPVARPVVVIGVCSQKKCAAHHQHRTATPEASDMKSGLSALRSTGSPTSSSNRSWQPAF